MKQQIEKALIFVAGYFFIVLGVVGLVLPVLQGVIFLFIGLAILATRSQRARRILCWMRRRFPRTYQHYDSARHKLSLCRRHLAEEKGLAAKLRSCMTAIRSENPQGSDTHGESTGCENQDERYNFDCGSDGCEEARGPHQG